MAGEWQSLLQKKMGTNFFVVSKKAVAQTFCFEQKLYGLLFILEGCFATQPVKGTLLIWLFWRDSGKSQICNTYNLLSFHDLLFHGVATSGWKVLCPILLIITMRQNKNKQFYPWFQVCKFFEVRTHTPLDIKSSYWIWLLKAYFLFCSYMRLRKCQA